MCWLRREALTHRGIGCTIESSRRRVFFVYGRLGVVPSAEFILQVPSGQSQPQNSKIQTPISGPIRASKRRNIDGGRAATSLASMSERGDVTKEDCNVTYARVENSGEIEAETNRIGRAWRQPFAAGHCFFVV